MTTPEPSLSSKDEKELRFLHFRLDEALSHLRVIKRGNLRMIINSLHYREYAHVCYLESRIAALIARTQVNR
jgi:hypothetical protein